MARFKISLIVPNNDNWFDTTVGNQKETYLSNVITDFTDQQQEYKKNKTLGPWKDHTVSYTYNEKLSEHKHGQKELSFSMDDKVLVEEEWVENPFSRILRTGVQLELQDKYNNRKLFTVNKIQYTFNNLSIVYNITCQDSFTYQLNRQNNGYILKNDETSIDFIGALNIDQWTEKIARECYLTYSYVPLGQGIYMDNTGVLHLFNTPDKNTEEPVSAVGTQVQKIIKPIYDQNTYKDYYETFPFSASGSSANAALISLAETLGLQVNVVEGLAQSDISKGIEYIRFFFFSPVKNPEVSGLTYSPLREIQNFGLSFSGDSLTTVLNIKSTTWNDEEISIFPTIPAFFNALFMNNNWSKTTYYPGFFQEAAKGKEYGGRSSEFFISDQAPDLIPSGKTIDDYSHYVTIDGQGYYAFPFKSENIKWTYYYNKIHFYWEDKDKYTLISGAEGQDTLNPFQSNDILCLGKHKNDSWSVYMQDEEIADEVLLDTDKWFLLIKWNDPQTQPHIDSCYFHITRNYTRDELDFAEIADQCPWLENKIMDFSYFVRQGILSKYEYQGLMDWLLNKLRIINGQLMCNAASYYQALHKQVKILSQIESSLDALGATFYASVIDPYTSTGTVSEDISNFINTYNSIFNIKSTDTPDTILNLNNIISDRFNKYFAAEQRFLRNMYEFRKYFEERNIYSLYKNTILEDVSYTLDTTSIDKPNWLITFKGDINWQHLISSSTIIHIPEEDTPEEAAEFKGAYSVVPLYVYRNKKYIEQKIPNHANYKEFYTPQIIAGSCVPVENNHRYNNANFYYLTLRGYELAFNTEPEEYRKIKIDNTDYVRLSYQEIVCLFLYQQLDSSTHKAPYYIRDTSLKVPFEWVRTNWSVINQAMNTIALPGLSIIANFNNNMHLEEVDTFTSNSTFMTYYWELYKSLLPIDQLYVYDWNIQYNAEQQNNNLVYNWTVYDENGTEYTKNPDGGFDHYINKNEQEHISNVTDLYHTFYPVNFVSYYNNAPSLIWGDRNETSINFNILKYWTDINNTVKNSKYFVCYEDTAAKGWALTGGIAATLLGIGSALIPGLGFLGTIGTLVGTIAIGLHRFSSWGQKDTTTFGMAYYGSSGNDSWTQLGYNKRRNGEVLGQKFVSGSSSRSFTGDSHWVNYVLNQDSEITIRTLVKEWVSSPWFTYLDSGTRGRYKHYSNYYKHIAATYSQGAGEHNDTCDLTDNFNGTLPNTYRVGFFNSSDSSYTKLGQYDRDYYWINNKYARFVSRNDYFNYKDDYVWVPAEYVKTDSNGIPVVTLRFSTIKFYPFVTAQAPVVFTDVYTLKELTENKYTFAQYITKVADNTGSASFENDYLITTTLHNPDGTPLKFYIVHLEPFEKLQVANTTQTLAALDPHNFTISWSEIKGKVYHLESDIELNSKEIILNNVAGRYSIYYVPASDDKLIKVSELSSVDWTDNDIHWYSDADITKRTYTVAQILEEQTEEGYYYLANTTQIGAELRLTTDNPVYRDFILQLRSYSINEDSQLIIDDNVITKEFKNIPFGAYSTSSTSISWDSDTNFTIVRNVNKSYNIGEMSNGEFWYYFHDRLDFPDIAEKSKIIETQLMQHWTSAYTASHYCQWFIPEFWQAETDSSCNNAWATSIWSVDAAGKVKLSDKLVPYIDIYKVNTKSELDDYTFIYHYGDFDKCDKEEYELETVDILKNNPVFIDTIQFIFKDIDPSSYGRFTARKTGKRTYYYYIGGGLLHSDILYTLNNSLQKYTKYSGLYCMQLRVLIEQYRNAASTMYEKLQNEKLLNWQALYTRYPGIFLENTYENSNARTSKQLLQMAQLAFKDYTSPEKQYNITTLDAAALDGYEGQELHIGDNILLNTSDYYDAVDETYRALNQYLFISDISYNLRQDTDINLTINIIKYQDKLLQSIVKLIR